MANDVRRLCQWLVVAFAAMLFFAWLVPNHYSPWTAFHSDWLAAVALTICFWGVAAQAKASRGVPIPAVVIAAVAAVPVVQGVMGQIHFAGDAWLAAVYVLGFAFSIHVGFAIRQRLEARSIEPLIWAILLAACISAILAMRQWLRVSDGDMFMMGMPPAGRPYANFAQPNQLATFLMMGLVCAITLYQWRRLTGVTLGVLAVLLCVGVALTQSRAAWLEMAGLVGWLLVMRQRAELRISCTAAVAIGATLFLFVVSLPALGDWLHLSARGLAQFNPGTRPIHWATVLDAISRQPWAGYGWNQVSVAVAHAAHDHPASHEMIEHSHNLLLDLLAWNGVPLGLAIIGAVAWWLWRCTSTCRDATSVLLLAIIAMPLLHSMVEFPLEYAYMLLPVGVLVGVLEASRENVRVVHVPRGVVAALAALITITVAWIGVEYMQVEENTRLLRFESAGIGASRIESSAPDLVLLTQQREFLRFARTEAKRNMSDEQLDWMRKVAERYGYPPVLLRYALATGLNGRPDAATSALVRLCKIHPAVLCEEARVNWASLVAGPYPELSAITVPASD